MHRIRAKRESRRTAALALWRYSHDYLRAAQSLSEIDRVTCNESQVSYHLAAQGIEFALKSFLRARGVTPDALRARFGHSLVDALHESMARGLPSPPPEVVEAIRRVAPHHLEDRFVHLEADDGAFPDLTPCLRQGRGSCAGSRKRWFPTTTFTTDRGPMPPPPTWCGGCTSTST